MKLSRLYIEYRWWTQLPLENRPDFAEGLCAREVYRMKPSVRNLNNIIMRQKPERFESFYTPAIQATRSEAPRTSRPSIIRSSRLGRDLHLLSIPERIATLLALYNPSVFDVHEQKMLSMLPIPHPLTGHARSIGMSLKAMRGTLSICEQMGELHRHAVISIPYDGQWEKVPYPYVGDLLVFCVNDQGKPYCVNWTVKKYVEDFYEKNRGRIKSLQQQRRDEQSAEFRQKVEELYYKDAGIQTIRVTPESVDAQVFWNLELLFSWHNRIIVLEASVIADLMAELNAGLLTGLVPFSIISKYLKYGDRSHLLCVYYRSIWERNLKVNLFEPVLVDKPMHAQQVDVLGKYGCMFAEFEK